MTTEEKTETQETSKHKEIADVEEWKAKHIEDKKEVISKKEEWRRKFLKVDGDNLSLKKENKRLKEELEEWENKDNAETSPISRSRAETEEQMKKKQRIQSFLKRIK